ncbi:hypothetical protein [Corynebacterium argentoratense]|nr:hypothetical protein [Corynebacterium argentoratense]MCF1712182.1 hypothetical protein [Corynebacterium argentoratense]
MAELGRMAGRRRMRTDGCAPTDAHRRMRIDGYKKPADLPICDGHLGK